MAALNSTTLASTRGLTSSSGDNLVRLASVALIAIGDQVVIDCEPMMVRAFLGTDLVYVVRKGFCMSHVYGATVYTGSPDKFRTIDPVGVPGIDVPNPWINVAARRIWIAGGDLAGPGIAARYWVQQQPVFGTGALGVRTLSVTP